MNIEVQQYLRDKREKVRRIETEILRFYKPNRVQFEAHKSQAEIRLMYGSNQTGKSWWGACETAWIVGKVHPYRNNYTGPVYARHCCSDFGVLESAILVNYKRLLPRTKCELNGMIWPGLEGGTWESAWDGQNAVLGMADGSIVEFKTYKQWDNDPLSYAGPPRHWVLHDEEPPQGAYEENLARQATVGRNVGFAMTPLNRAQWIHAFEDLSLKDPKVGFFQMTMYDNPMISHEFIHQLEDSIEDPAERAARVYGKPTFTEGRVWKEIGPHNVCEPFDLSLDFYRRWPKTLVLDPHPEKACGVNAFALDPSSYKAFCFYENDIKGDVDYICDTIKSELGSFNISTVLLDPSCKQKATTRGQGSLYEMFCEMRNFPGAVLANNDKVQGIEEVRRWVKNGLNGPRMNFFTSCPLTYAQCRDLSWRPPLASGEYRSKPEVVKKKDEHPDNTRYFCMQYAGQNFFIDNTPSFNIHIL